MRRILSLTLVGLLLFGSDVAFHRDWPVARVRAVSSYLGAVTAKFLVGGDTTATSAAVDTTGATLLVIGRCDNGAGNTPTDSPGNTFTGLTATNGGSISRATIYYKVSPTTSATHTFTVSGAAGNRNSAFMAWFSGTAAFDVEAHTGSSASGTTVQPGSVTPTLDAETLFSVVCWGDLTFGDGHTASVGSSFNLITGQLTDAEAGGSGHYGTAAAWKIQTTAGAENPTWTLSASETNLASSIATFKAAAVTLRQSLLSGVGP